MIHLWFVVGSWMHCGYHLTTSIVGPPLLGLPYAFTFLGWTAGVLCLVIGALTTFYSYNLISLVLEHHAHLGRRQLRFRDMARHILGTKRLPCVIDPVVKEYLIFPHEKWMILYLYHYVWIDVRWMVFK